MGYEHHWAVPAVVDRERWVLFTADVRRLYESLPERIAEHDACYPGEILDIANSSGEPGVDITDDQICFNGYSRPHELFVLNRVHGGTLNKFGEGGGWCKTARKPYDLFVCATLLALVHHFPEACVASCGSASEWRCAVELFEKVVGPVPLQGPWHRLERDEDCLSTKD
ncbi:MAG: hypothetical protein IT462_11485 [Planctomycetes bacterium]|nr:hypothetical protein [Planctomycetota bacterium]